MTRRELLFTAAAFSLSPAETSSRMSVEGYIFQQYAESLKKPLGDVIGEVFPMARQAGFHNVELNPNFFAPDIRARALALLREKGFGMPSVYVGGVMHEPAAADQTIVRALEIGQLCQPFGCTAIVNNPDPKRGDTEKTDAELQVEAASLNRMGQRLAEHGFELRVHHHTPQLVNKAREWRYILQHTDPKYVAVCVDLDWAYEGGFEPIAFLREVGPRLREIHVRSARNKLWLEDVEDSDIDYHQVAAYLKQARLEPLTVVELAYRPATVITRPLQEDLRLSRVYVERVFGLNP
jgi:sugar phosphate isomerase/epimerase